MKRIFTILATVCMLFCMTVTTFAYDIDGNNVLPVGDIMEQYKTTYPYAVVYDDNTSGYWLVLLNTPPIRNTEKKYTQASSDSYSYKMYKFAYNGSSWVTSGTGSSRWYMPEGSTLELTSYDIKSGNNVLDSADTDFFLPPPPLAEVIQGVTEETMQGTLPGLAGTMKVLVPCGVGLMALLVGLKLFGKRSLLFLR